MQAGPVLALDFPSSRPRACSQLTVPRPQLWTGLACPVVLPSSSPLVLAFRYHLALFQICIRRLRIASAECDAPVVSPPDSHLLESLHQPSIIPFHFLATFIIGFHPDRTGQSTFGLTTHPIDPTICLSWINSKDPTSTQTGSSTLWPRSRARSVANF